MIWLIWSAIVNVHQKKGSGTKNSSVVFLWRRQVFSDDSLFFTVELHTWWSCVVEVAMLLSLQSWLCQMTGRCFQSTSGNNETMFKQKIDLILLFKSTRQEQWCSAAEIRILYSQQIKLQNFWDCFPHLICCNGLLQIGSELWNEVLHTMHSCLNLLLVIFGWLPEGRGRPGNFLEDWH